MVQCTCLNVKFIATCIYFNRLVYSSNSQVIFFIHIKPFQTLTVLLFITGNNTVFPPPPLPVEPSLRRKLMDELQSQQGNKECISYALQYYKNCANNTATDLNKLYSLYNIQCNDCHMNM